MPSPPSPTARGTRRAASLALAALLLILTAPMALGVEPGAIEGTVTDAEDGAPLEADVELDDGTTTTSDDDGTFVFDDVDPQTWTVTASADGYTDGSVEVVVEEDETATADVALDAEPVDEAAETGVVRVSGANRFTTAVALSQRTHPDGADTVYLATGGQFPDALTGAAAAALDDAPMLFTPPGNLMGPVADEIERLEADTAVVLGGPAAVNPPVVDQVDELVDDVVRVGGGNRFGTAVAVSQFAHPDGSDHVVLATGGDFPDALTGAPLAADVDAPVLLATRGQLPDETAAELAELQPETVTVLGGGAAIDDRVVEQVESATAGAEIERIAGSDRFGTAVEVSRRLAPDGSDDVYVATGVGWADALAGAAAAGADGAPALLVTPGQVPDPIADELVRLEPTTAVVLGGPSAVTDRVADAIAELIGAEDTTDDGAGPPGDPGPPSEPGPPADG